MRKKHEINWREPSEDEIEYIKERYSRPTMTITVGIVFILLLVMASVGFLIYCNIKKHDVGVVISSVILSLVSSLFIIAIFCVIVADIRRIRCISGRKLLVADASVQNVSVQMRSRGKSSTTVQLATSTGVQLSMRSSGLKPLASKGKRALILNFGKTDKKDWRFVVKE